MGYSQIVPQNISKMQNRVVGPLTFRDIGVIMGVFSIGIMIFAGIPVDNVIIKGVPAVIFAAIGLGFGFIHFLTDMPPIEEYIFTWYDYKMLPKKVTWKKEIIHTSGYYASDSTQSFFPFEISKEGILLYHDEIGGAILLKVGGVDYQLLSDGERDIIISTFGDFLDTITFPIQILTKTTPLDLRSYRANAEKYFDNNKQHEKLAAASADYLDLIQNYQHADFIYNKSMYIVIPYTLESENAGNKSLGVVSNASSIDNIKSDNPIGNLFKKKDKDALDLSALQAKEFSKEFTTKMLKDRSQIVKQFLSGVQGVNCRQASLPEYVELFYYFFNVHESNIQAILNNNPTDNIASQTLGYAESRANAAKYKEKLKQEEIYDINSFLN